MSFQAPEPGNVPPMAPAPVYLEPQAAQGPPPAPVVNAFRVLLGAAALSLLGIVATVTSMGAIRDQLRDAQLDVSESTLDAAVTAAVAVSVVFGLLGVALWVWLAFKVRQGRSWARITTFIFVGLGVLSVLSTLTSPAAPLSRVISLAGLALYVAVVVLLTRSPAVEYFRKRP